MGTLGPGPAPLASRPNPRALKGLGPKASRPKNARSTIRPGTPRGLGPEVSRPTNAWPILRLGARVSHIPDAFLIQVLTFPIGNSTKRSYQPALHITSASLPMNSPCRLRHNRKVLLVVVLSGRQLRKWKNKSSFPK